MTISACINLAALSSGSTLICKATCGFHRTAVGNFIWIYSPPGMEVGHHIRIWERSNFRDSLSTQAVLPCIITLYRAPPTLFWDFFFNGEVGMVSLIHWNIFAKGQTPVWCPPTPTVPYAWPSVMLNLKHIQQSVRCWKNNMGWEFILAWIFLTDFLCWVWTVFK